MGCGTSKNKVAVADVNVSQVTIKSSAKQQEDVEQQSYQHEEIVEEDVTPVKTVVVPTKIDPYREFPAPHILKLANIQYTIKRNPLPRTEDNELDAYPCPSAKADVYREDEFAFLEDHCIQTPAQLRSQPLQQLVDYLISNPRTSSDVGKVRAIYRWITAQTVSNLPHTISISAMNSAYSYLSVQDGKWTWQYNNLFIDMCQCAGLNCKKIVGIVKGVNYNIGDKLTRENSYSTWAAVLINNTWRLVDAHWGATYINDPNTGEWVLIDDESSNKRGSVSGEIITQHYYCNNFYFLTDPEEFVYSHLPNDSKWQLLARPVTEGEFDEMVKLSQGFFTTEMKLDYFRSCVQYCMNGEINLTFELPVGHDVSFSYNLWISKKGQTDDVFENNDSLRGIKLTRYVFFQRLGNQEVINISFPVIGKFKIDIYGKKCETGNDKGNRAYPHLCAYIIYCDSPKPDCVPLPENVRGEWGPGFDLQQAGLKAVTHTTGEIDTEKGVAHMEFHAEDDVVIMANLHADSKDDKLNNYVIHHREGGKIKLTAKVPEKGQYALNIYAKRRHEEGQYRGVCTYLMVADEAPEDPTPFPEGNNGHVGPSANRGDLLKLISPSSALVETVETEMIFVFKILECIDLICHLKQGTMDGITDKSHLVLGYKEDDNYTCITRFPEPGMYVLEIYTRPSNSADGTTFSYTYNCLIKALMGNPELAPFPCSRIGPTGSKENVVKLLSPESALVDTIETELKFQFKILAPVDVMCTFKQGINDGSTAQRNEIVMGVKEDDNYACFTRFPETGFYVLEIYTRPSTSQDGTTYSLAYTCLIKAELGNSEVLPFPKIFSSWKDGQLLEPLSGILPSNQAMRFALTAPHACDIVAIMDGNWTHLKRRGDGVWEGDVTTGAAGTTAKISGKTEIQSSSYWGFMDFEIKDGIILPMSDEKIELAKKRTEEEEGARSREEKEAEEARIAEEMRKREEARLMEEARIAARKKKQEEEEEQRRKENEEAERKRREQAEKYIKDLISAIKSRNKKAILKAMDNIKKNKHQQIAAKEMEEARRMLDSLIRMERLKQAVLNMDQATMSEMRSYKNPPSGVHEIMKAVLLLLGDDEAKTQNWNDCQNYITNISREGKVPLQRRVKTFQIESTHPEIATRVMQILGKWRIEDVQAISEGTVIFYDWAGGMVEELFFLNRNARNALPADIPRQQELLKQRK